MQLHSGVSADGIQWTIQPERIQFVPENETVAENGWQSTKIGASPIPIETTEGWLRFYHRVLTSCNGFVYSFGAALLDLDQPWKVMYRGEPYLLAPQAPYERTGDVPNVAFPCAALTDAESGRIAIYIAARIRWSAWPLPTWMRLLPL